MKTETKFRKLEQFYKWIKEDITLGEMHELAKNTNFSKLEELCKILNQLMIELESIKKQEIKK